MHYYISSSTMAAGSDRILAQPPLRLQYPPAVLTNYGNRDYNGHAMLQITDRTDKLSESVESVKFRGEGEKLSI